MAESATIKEKLEALATRCGQKPRRVTVAEAGDSHTLNLAFVGKREASHSAIARLTKSLLDAGLVELPQGTAPTEESLYNLFRQNARDRDTFLGNATLTGKTDTMSTLSIKTSLPADAISIKLQDALDAHARKDAQQQVESYLVARAKKNLPFGTIESTVLGGESPTQRKFSLHIRSELETGSSRFFENIVELTRNMKHLFGDSTPVKLSTEGIRATLSVTGNPTLLLDAIKQKDPHFISQQAAKSR